MATRTVIFTACPNGIGPNGLPLLSVHIAPRLVPTGPGDGVLNDFADWKVWPDEVLAPWNVVIAGQTIAANEVTNPTRDSARWSALFDPLNTLVRARPGAEDFTGRKLRSYPVGNVYSFLQNNYATIAATSGDQYPNRQQLGPLINALQPRVLQEALQEIEQELIPAPHVIGPAALNPTKDFAQLKKFHTPSALRKDPFDPADNATVPKLDFHEGISLAQDHPVLLRLLGLVIDLELTRFPDFIGNTTCFVLPTPNPAFPAGTTVSTPRTSCSISRASQVFRAEPSATNTEVKDQYLRLDDSQTFGVIPVDQDGGGLKAIDVSNNIFYSAEHSSIDTPTNFSLPVLRSRGLGIFHTGRALSLHTDKFVRAKALDPNVGTGSPPGTGNTLFLEDITQGYRFDALDAAIGTWRSLCARVGQFKFTTDNVTVPVASDEAKTSAGATQAFDGSSDDLYVGEEIIAWNGWSVGASRPAKPINNDDALMDESSTAHPNGFPIEIHYDVAPGTLPRLRFGHAYQFRARAVDLAGNSLALADGSVTHASQRTFFGRLDPVESPAILLRLPRGAGEAVDRVVLRSNYNVAANPPTTERHLLAAKVGELMCEMHGMFDTAAPNSKVDVNAYALIADHESKTLGDLPAVQDDPKGDGALFLDQDHGKTPYLPDPVSSGALLRGVGGATDEVTVKWDGAWPDLGSTRVIMHEQPNPPAFPDFIYDSSTNTLDLYVGKADTLNVRLSTAPDIEKIRQFGLLPWILGLGLPPATFAAIRADIEAGRNWMFTPFRPMTFVHAVKQPLVFGQWQSLRVIRHPGDTFATLDGRLAFSRKSTARVDLDASWNEYIDVGPGGDPPTRPDPNVADAWVNDVFLDRPVNQAIPISAPVPAAGLDNQWSTNETPTPGPRHEFHDTKHRDVKYPTRVYSRFDEYFRKEADIDFGAANPLLLDGAGIVKGSVHLTKLVSGKTLAFTEDVDYSVDLVGGHLTRLAGSTMPDQVHASWVPAPNDRVGPSTAQPVNVPSSARPDAPKLVYVLPTFSRFTTLGIGGQRQQHRTGPGVRVYLERPWWTSGGGEMLAVVMAANPPFGPQAVLPDDVARYCTQWGVDPVHAGAFTPEAPQVTNFPLRINDSNPRGIAELPGVDLAVAGHAVGFDASRDLWYCDIDIDTGNTYFPFVRLAIARWQPGSLGSLDISPVVLADYIQLAADRVATVTPPQVIIRGQQPTYQVALSGPGYPTTLSDQKGLMAQVTFQKRRAPGLDGPLAWVTTGSPVALTRVLNTNTRLVSFTGGIKLPKGIPTADLRLLFEEFEQIETDGKVNAPVQIGKRVVYADVVPIANPS